MFGLFLPQAVRWRRNVCSQEGGVLSVVAGFIPIRGSRSGRRPLDIACSSALVFFLPSCSVSIGLFSFTFSLFFRRMFGLFLHKLFAGGETYAPKKEVSFLSSLVSSPSAAQGAAKDLWSTRMPPGAEAQVQSEMAEQAPRLLSRYLCTSKRKVRNACRGKASLPRAASRLLTAQRSFRSKLAPATETSACKSHKF